jgi:SecD/SecF fusion protein
MRRFFWRFILCLIPCVVAALVTSGAVARYLGGEAGGFKLGPDLAGGTILVYEVDLRKLDKGQFDPAQLAAALHRRIDPNDLYNIIIRPAGGEGRVEIILPTGGVYRTQKAQEGWDELVRSMEEKYKVKNLDVGRGRILELADRIHTVLAEKVWSEKIFNDAKTWQRLRYRFWKTIPSQWPVLLRTQDDFPLDYSGKTYKGPVSAFGHLASPCPLAGAANAATSFEVNRLSQKLALDRVEKLKKVPIGDFKGFVETLVRELGDPTAEKVLETWIRNQAWAELLLRARERWPEIKDSLALPKAQETKLGILQQAEKAAWDEEAAQERDKGPGSEVAFGAVRLQADQIDELIGLIQSEGNVVAQGALTLLDPVVSFRNFYSWKSKAGLVDEEIAKQFVEENYGPSQQTIVQDIQDRYKASGFSKDLNLEEVQRIKDLVAKVGSLEFRILANGVDDKAAEKDMIETYGVKVANDPALQQKLKELAEKGLPPPGPRDPITGQPKIYEIQLPRNNKGLVTYSWVELGPQERHLLGLDNAAQFDPKRNQNWLKALESRNKAAQIPDPTSTSGRYLLQGALFYSRKCEDRNLPEEERRQKAIEYFVLTRDPEIDPKRPFDLPLEERRTPKIDGSYLRNAMSGHGSDLRPAVHFTFNEAGGNLFGDLTRKNVPTEAGPDQIKRHLAIVLDGLIMSAPTINSEIRTQGQISGSFTKREVDNLVNILRAGALPASLKPQPVSESTLGATLGEDTINAGVRAIVVAFAAVLVFMLVYYRFAGLVASLALLANLLLTIGFMVFVQATFTLPGLAGLVLMLGMAVDANVLIYERLREERERGAGLALAIRNGYDRAFPTIIDTHLSSIFTAIVLYIVGNDQLKGFGVSLTVGLIISLFTSLFMTRLMFDFWQARNWLRKLSMLRLFSRPDIDFMGARYIFFTLTLVLSIVGIVLFIGRLPNDLNIDFVGGTAYGGKLRDYLTIRELRDLVNEDSQKKWLRVARVEEEKDSNGGRFQIVYRNPDGSESAARSVSLANKIEEPTVEERQKVMKARAEVLPDSAVEQLFPSFDPPPQADQSRYFTVRTSEKEPELVQASLDRLLHYDKEIVDRLGRENRLKGQTAGEPLLEKIHLWFDPVTSTGTQLRFYAVKPPADFNGPADAQKKEQEQLPGAYASPSFVRTLFTRELMKLFGKKDRSELPFQFELLGEGKTQDGRYKVLRMKFSEALREAQLAKVKIALETTQREFEARPQPERLENFDTQLAAETRFRAMWAILASWGAIAMYLWFRFGNWTFGLAAVICLIHDLFFTLGVVAGCYYIHATWFGQMLLLEDFKIDLPAVAALLTLVGYSVNDTIVVFDRIREVRGKNPDLTPQMINDSVNQTLSRTLLTSLTTWLVVFVLYVWGGPGVRLFAFVMVVGVIVGTYSSIYIASPLLLILGEGTKQKEARRQPPAQPVGATV